jgi:2-phosphoglycolate phosphatase
MSAPTPQRFNVKFLIFDLDGTLVDSRLDIATAMNATFTSLGLDPSPMSEIESFIGIGVTSLIPHRLSSRGATFVAKALAKYEDTYASYLVDATRPYPGAIEVLEHFKSISKIVLTNKSSRFVAPILKGLGLDRYFTASYGAQCLAFRKPDPQTILEICSRHGASPQNALLIGDTETDIATGKAASCHTCAVTYGYGDISKIRTMNPDLVIDDLRELLDPGLISI